MSTDIHRRFIQYIKSLSVFPSQDINQHFFFYTYVHEYMEILDLKCLWPCRLKVKVIIFYVNTQFSQCIISQNLRIASWGWGKYEMIGKILNFAKRHWGANLITKGLGFFNCLLFLSVVSIVYSVNHQYSVK